MEWLIFIFSSICKWPVSDIIAFFNCIFTGFFLLATIISVACAFGAYKHQKERARKETACNLARYYAENIIARHSYVMAVIQYAGIEEQAKALFPYDELLQFNRDEMLAFIGRKGLTYQEVKDSFWHLDPEAILAAKYSFAASLNERQNIAAEYIVTDKETGDKKIGYVETLQTDFVNKVQRFLNDLEWFSMSCRYGVSDEEILYQSLHTTFLSTIWLLYFYICDKNTTNEDKLFTNIIWLFSKWRERLMSIQKRAGEKQAKAQKKIVAAERKRMMAEQRLKETKPEVYSGKPLKK